jgi:hypothetical protein
MFRPPEEAGGVAPAPNRTRFLLTQGEAWGAETLVMFDLAQAIAEKPPVMVIMIAQVALSEILHSVRRDWRVLMIAGTKGTAGELAAQWTAKVAKDDNPLIAEILADGDLHAFPIGDPPEVLARRIGRELSGKCGSGSGRSGDPAGIGDEDERWALASVLGKLGTGVFQVAGGALVAPSRPARLPASWRRAPAGRRSTISSPTRSPTRMNGWST